MVDARYRNKKNGRVAVIVQEDAKYKTALIQYEDDESEQQVSMSTLKRWWELIDDDDEEYEEEVEGDQEEEYEEYEDDSEELEDDAEDDTADVEDDEPEELEEEPAPKKTRGKKTVAASNEKAAKSKGVPKEKKARKQAEANPAVAEMMDYVLSVVKEQGGEVYAPASQRGTRAFKVGGHMYARLLSTRSGVTLTCRDTVTDEIAEPTKKINHMFANLYTYESMNATDKKLVKKLLQASLKYQQAKNDSKEAKATGKKATKKGGKKNA